MLPERFGHALVAPVVAHVFEAIGVSATLWDGRRWWVIHNEPSVSEFEHEHRVDTERIDYNERHFAQAQRQKKVIRGELAGHWDLFVPIVAERQRWWPSWSPDLSPGRGPTSARLAVRWRALTGRQAHLADPEFAFYLERSLSTLVLDGEKLVSFERLLRLPGAIAGW